MKQIGRSFFLLFLCVWLAMPAMAASGYQISLSSESTVCCEGDRITVSVDVTKSGSVFFAAADVTILYDSACLSLLSVHPAGVRTDSSVAGKIRLLDYGENKKFGSGVYTLVFEALETGDAAISVASAAFSSAEDAARTNLEAADAGSVLTISIRYPEDSQRGDADGDGQVTVKDLLRLVKYALGLISVEEVKCNPDVNGNKSFGLDDLICVLRLLIVVGGRE